MVFSCFKNLIRIMNADGPNMHIYKVFPLYLSNFLLVCCKIFLADLWEVE